VNDTTGVILRISPTSTRRSLAGFLNPYITVAQERGVLSSAIIDTNMRMTARPLLRGVNAALAPHSHFARLQPSVRAFHQPSLVRARAPYNVASSLRASRFSELCIWRRQESSLATTGEAPPQPQDVPPAYQLTFTCKPCSTRSSHRVTKQGYHHGTTLITCPNCKARHLISDHLKIFSDERITLEDILSKTLPDGKPLTDLLKKGKLGMRQGAMIANEGDEGIEFWEDGSETTHQKAP
jgi:mitochondrial protein import protein ZIM17